MSGRAKAAVAVPIALTLFACAAARTPPPRALSEPEFTVFTDLVVRFHCAHHTWPESLSELRDFASRENVSFDWEPIVGSTFSSRGSDFVEVHLHPQALPLRHQVSFESSELGSVKSASIRIYPRSCVTEPKLTHRTTKCELIAPDEIGSVDVAIVIDSSASTSLPSGLDVNRNGTVGSIDIVVGEPRGTVTDPSGHPRVVQGESAWFDAPPVRDVTGSSTDPGDSLLALQIAAARELIQHLEQADVRFSVISYSDLGPIRTNKRNRRRRADPDVQGRAIVRAELTKDAATLSASLDEVLDFGSAGGSAFSAAMASANTTLLQAPEAPQTPRRIVLFISDSPLSTLKKQSGETHQADPDMKAAAEVAIDSSIVFHTFGLGQAAATRPPHALSRIAGATGGEYRPIGVNSNFSCQLIRSLAAN